MPLRPEIPIPAPTSGLSRAGVLGRWLRVLGRPRGFVQRTGGLAQMGLTLLWLIGAGLHPGRSAPLPGGEYQLKAVFLFNFVQFVEWPASAHATKDSPIVIGIVGEDPFGAALEDTVKGEKVNGRSLEVRRFKEGDDVTAFHLLFISSSAKAQAVDLLPKLQGRPVLTVSETPGFAEHGGVINFVVVSKKVRFEVNPQTAARHGLKVSSKLLQVARVVDGGGEGKRP